MFPHPILQHKANHNAFHKSTSPGPCTFRPEAAAPHPYLTPPCGKGALCPTDPPGRLHVRLEVMLQGIRASTDGRPCAGASPCGDSGTSREVCPYGPTHDDGRREVRASLPAQDTTACRR